MFAVLLCLWRLSHLLPSVNMEYILQLCTQKGVTQTLESP